jgi:hypothetical protein
MLPIVSSGLSADMFDAARNVSKSHACVDAGRRKNRAEMDAGTDSNEVNRLPTARKSHFLQSHLANGETAPSVDACVQ